MTGKSLRLEIDLVREDEPDEMTALYGADDTPAAAANPPSFDPAAFLDALHEAVIANCPGVARESLDALLGGKLLQQAIETALLLDKPQGKA